MTLIKAPESILIITTGGTIDKVYFDAKSDYEVGATIIGNLLTQAEVYYPYKILELLQKDSLELTDQDREAIREAVTRAPETRIIITHGTDTMTETASQLSDMTGKTIVLTGSLAPARFAMSDAMFNIGMAVSAVQTLDEGVYIAMNGQVFVASEVFKNRDLNRFQRKL